MRTTRKGNPGQAVPIGAPLQAEAFHPRVAEKAYELFLKNGQTQAHDLDDWREAEGLVELEIAARTTLRSGTPLVKSPKPGPAPGRRHLTPRQ